MSGVTLHHGDMLDVLAGIPADTFHACVTDPPYHLTQASRAGSPRSNDPTTPFGRTRLGERGFMGKTWDGGDIALRPETWAAVLRVLKPGAHLVAFGGTRTFHRMACAIEDAGFEIRDTLMWLYGTGFPKSHDVSRTIDRAAGHVRGTTPDTRNGPNTNPATKGDKFGGYPNSAAPRLDTGPITDAAREWTGWGTALKPGYEPIILARKPLAGTVAQNVQAHGTGALNIDACRVSSSPGQRPYEVKSWVNDRNLCALCAADADKSARHGTPEIAASTAIRHAEELQSGKDGPSPRDTNKADTSCFAGAKVTDTATSLSTVACGKPQTAPSQPGTTSTTSTATEPTTGSKTCVACHAQITPQSIGSTAAGMKNSPHAPASSASAVPASALGRWPANCLHDGSEEVEAAFAAFGERGAAAPVKGNEPSAVTNGIYGKFNARVPGSFFGDKGTASRFFYSAKASAADRAGSKHLTVKPVALMRWLVRLVTPPGGLVLDPFAGSGTTGAAALAEGVRCVLVEREAEYAEDIRRRVAAAQAAPKAEDVPPLLAAMGAL